MYFFAFLLRTGIFAEGRFLGKILDEWIGDAQEFVHTKLPRIIFILLVAFILTRLISVATQRMIRIADRKSDRPGRHFQVKTFASILRTTLNTVLWAIAALQIFSALGANLGPLLAGASIIGVAVGLAAQTIVKDVINGMLIILEDQFNIGDVVRLTGMTGTVEVMSLRRTEVRDGDGTLYVIPNSQITTVANLSRDFSVATVNVNLDFSATPEKVISLLTSIAMDVRKDPAFAPVFVADPQILGVDSIVGSQVVYPVVFKTQATKQYGPIREFRRRVRDALEQNGMLPGDPNRIFTGDKAAQAQLTMGHRTPEEASAHPPIDPTAIPAKAIDPFTAES
ncbi:mechanosensitive ion channel family protein [Acidicapsa dinghuensis]|uniref:Mechanosensitive ion channel family protein n=1 Tax=Acidicapsa dinghuensis TaxID=2218256 RepID=A0ABW1ELI8_9BACT|nr:mechanosensitive ion channel family protein [Acidicapsa dinghuensis]